MKICDNIFQLESTQYSHAFLIRDDDVFLIDTGMPGLTCKIIEEVLSLGISKNDIRAIMLTHHDVDHIGNAKKLQDITGAELWAPKEDVPYIIGEKKRPGIKHLIESVARTQSPIITGTFGEDWKFNDINFINAPGHTPGHTIFKFQNVVFTGDLFKFNDGKFKLLSKHMTWNQDELKKSLAILKSLDFECLCPAHGEPVHNGPELQDFLNKMTMDKNSI